MDDITPANRRMTYAELAEARGITTGSAEQLARRRRWPRQIGNDGIARVLVPIGEDCHSPRHQGANKAPTKPPDIGQVIGAMKTPISSPLRQGPIEGPMTAPDIWEVIGQAIRDVVAPLSEQLDVVNRLLDEERAANRDLRRQFDEERARTADATAAERVARDEAAGLRAELDARRQWGLWRRVRGR